MEKIIIRKAEEKDCEAIIKLRSELAKYQNIIESNISGIVTKTDLERDGFLMNPPLFHCLVAEEVSSSLLENDNSCSNSKTIVGYAMYIIGYPIWEGKEIAVQDLYVAENKRGLGIGKLFLRQLAKIALDGNYCRVSMDCPKALPASEFCIKNLGIDMTLAEEWHILRFSKENFHRLTDLH